MVFRLIVMDINRIEFDTIEFKKIIKDAPTDIIIFNRKADYYCLKIDGKIVSISGVIKHKNGYKIISCFTYPEFRNNHYSSKLINHIINFYKADYYYCNANENSYHVFERFGFCQISFTQYKNFTRRVMILDRCNHKK